MNDQITARKDIFTFCKLLDFEPMPKQREAFDAANRGDKEIILRGGRGENGKTAASVIFALWKLFGSDPTNAELHLAVCPTYRSLEHIWMREAKQWASKRPDLFLVKKREIVLLTGYKAHSIRGISFVGLDNGNEAGLHADKTIITMNVEGSFVHPDYEQQVQELLCNKKESGIFRTTY